MNTESKQTTDPKRHHLSLVGRAQMEIRGVSDVLSFDEQTILLSTVCGNMEIGGSSLHIHVLSMEEGIVTLDGKIDSVTYYEAPSETHQSGFFAKLFH